MDQGLAEPKKSFMAEAEAVFVGCAPPGRESPLCCSLNFSVMRHAWVKPPTPRLKTIRIESSKLPWGMYGIIVPGWTIRAIASWACPSAARPSNS